MDAGGALCDCRAERADAQPYEPDLVNTNVGRCMMSISANNLYQCLNNLRANNVLVHSVTNFVSMQTIAAVSMFSIAGELVASYATGPASFYNLLLDKLYNFSNADFTYAK